MITYSIKGDKYVFCKDGVYFSLTYEQIKKMYNLFDEIRDNVMK